MTGWLPHILIIDGRSGSGKTTLATFLAKRLSANILHMDDLYRGWRGLLDAPQLLVDALSTGNYSPYHWETARLGKPRSIAPGIPLIIEGCGSLTSHTLEASIQATGHPERVRAIWVECDDTTRRTRALARDGDLFRPHWDTWATQEETLYAREHPRDLAHMTINTSGTTNRVH